MLVCFRGPTLTRRRGRPCCSGGAAALARRHQPHHLHTCDRFAAALPHRSPSLQHARERLPLSRLCVSPPSSRPLLFPPPLPATCLLRVRAGAGEAGRGGAGAWRSWLVRCSMMPRYCIMLVSDTPVLPPPTSPQPPASQLPPSLLPSLPPTR